MTDAVNPDYEDAYYKLFHKDSKEKPMTEQQKVYAAKRWRTDLMQGESIAAQKALELLNYASGPEACKKFFEKVGFADEVPQLSSGTTTTCRLCGETMVFDMNTGLTAAHTCSGCSQPASVFVNYEGTKERCGNCGDQADKIECSSDGYFISAWCDDCIGEIEQQNMQTKAMAYYAYCKELESDNFDFSSFSPSEFESAQRKNKLPRTLGAIPPDFNPKPPFDNAAQHEKSKANQTVIVILFNGETGEWEAWEDGDSDPMYRHENVLEVVDDCLCDYDVIEVHNNA